MFCIIKGLSKQPTKKEGKKEIGQYLMIAEKVYKRFKDQDLIFPPNN